MGNISYKKRKTEIRKAMDILNVSTNKAVGEKSFEYLMEYEGDD